MMMMREYDEIEGETAEENLRTEWTLQCVFQVTALERACVRQARTGHPFMERLASWQATYPDPAFSCSPTPRRLGTTETLGNEQKELAIDPS